MHFLIKPIQNPMRHDEVQCVVQDREISGGTETRARYCLLQIYLSPHFEKKMTSAGEILLFPVYS